MGIQVIKLLVQTIGYNLPYKKLSQIWSPKVELVAIDLANDFFITKFSLPEDYQFVLREGSWMSFDHYLVIRRWHPNFNQDKATIDEIMVGLRFLNLY
ncbi:hypothetical protein BT93_C0684 [Corymbia citriodora subsp. variegata]|nr:hypothetical protein BT93_C0684 [Corymbia citriodora subsp. variegata]